MEFMSLNEQQVDHPDFLPNYHCFHGELAHVVCFSETVNHASVFPEFVYADFLAHLLANYVIEQIFHRCQFIQSDIVALGYAFFSVVYL